MAQDVLLMFTNKVVVKFTIEGKVKILHGRWCSTCKWVNKVSIKEENDSQESCVRGSDELMKKHSKVKAFFTGGNSSCRYHIRQHYDLYKEQCENANIPEHHWVIPQPLWKEMQALKNGIKVEKQANLDVIVLKAKGPCKFIHNGLQDAITWFITCDDQVRYNWYYMYAPKG